MTKSADKEKAGAKPKASDKPKAKNAEIEHSEVALLPVKVQQERFLYAYPVQRRTPAASIVIKGKKYQIQNSAFNPETKRMEHALEELVSESVEKTSELLISQGWIAQS